VAAGWSGDDETTLAMCGADLAVPGKFQRRGVDGCGVVPGVNSRVWKAPWEVPRTVGYHRWGCRVPVGSAALPAMTARKVG